MIHYEYVSLTGLADAMIEAVEVGMSAGFCDSKNIDGQSIEEWVTDYIRFHYDEDFGKHINEKL